MDMNKIMGLVLLVLGVVDLTVVPALFKNTFEKLKLPQDRINSILFWIRLSGAIVVALGLLVYSSAIKLQTPLP